jgi:hypothetical protein
MAACARDCEGKTAFDFSLRPVMPELSSPGVPMLDEHTIDADLYPETHLSIEPEQLYRWVFQPGERITFNLKTQAETVLTVWDWENRPVSQRQFGGPFTNTVRFDVTGRGTYVLTLDAMKEGKAAYRLVRNLPGRAGPKRSGDALDRRRA